MILPLSTLISSVAQQLRVIYMDPFRPFISINDDCSSSLKEVKWQKHLTLYHYNGYWYAPSTLQAAMNIFSHYKPLPNDVILASFPKTGTTWLKALLYSILNRSSRQSLISNHPHELVPTLELQVYGPNTSSNHQHLMGGSSAARRLFSTHIPYQHFTDHNDIIKSSECKVVYVTRNPKDALMSLWHFVKKAKKAEEEEVWPLEMAVEKFCSGVVPYGPYYDHVLGYKKESLERPNNVFFTTFEELKNDTKALVKRLASFLGCPFAENEEWEVEEIVKSCSLDTLKEHEVNKSNDFPSWFGMPYNAYFRLGEIGDHKKYLNTEMIERIDAVTREKFHGSGFMYGI